MHGLSNELRAQDFLNVEMECMSKIWPEMLLSKQSLTIELCCGQGRSFQYLLNHVTRRLIGQDLRPDYLLAAWQLAFSIQLQHMIHELIPCCLTKLAFREGEVINLAIGFGVLGYINDQDIGPLFYTLLQARCRRVLVRESYEPEVSTKDED